MVAVDEFEVDDAPAPAHPEQRAPRAHPRHRALLWCALAVALIVSGTLAAPPGGLMFGGLPIHSIGIIGVDLAKAPTVAWSRALDPSPLYSIQVIGNTVTGDAWSGGYDIVTGEQLWPAVAPDSAMPVAANLYPCVTTAVYTCVISAGTASAQLVQIDPTTGDRHVLDYPDAWAAVGIDDDFVVIRNDRAIVRVNGDGSGVWRSAERLPGPVNSQDSGGVWIVGVLDNHAVLSQPTDGTALIDLDTGELTNDDAQYQPLPNGTWLRNPYDITATVEHLSADGEVLSTGNDLYLDDDPGSSVTIAFDPDLNATAVRDGTDELWHYNVGEFPLGRLDGVLLSLGPNADGEVTARDERTGEQLWQRGQIWPLGIGGGGTFLVSPDAGGIAGIDVHTGADQWTYSGSVWQVQPLADGLLICSDEGLTRLRW